MNLTQRLTLLVAEGFGLGRLPVAPGTWGSLWGPLIGWSFYLLTLPWWSRLLVAVTMFVTGVPICAQAAELRKIKDPGSVVWDEMAAFPIVFLFVSTERLGNFWVLVLGFVLFRIFDVWKPPPVSTCDRLEGGLGIMLDDTVAAVYACIVLTLVTRFWK